jgi:hypothetical protein
MTRPTASTTTARPAATAGTVTRSPLVTTSREPQVIPQPRSPRSHVGPNIEQRPTLVRETGLVCWRLDCGDWRPNRTVRSARRRHGRRMRGARAGHRRRSPQNTSSPAALEVGGDVPGRNGRPLGHASGGRVTGFGLQGAGGTRRHLDPLRILEPVAQRPWLLGKDFADGGSGWWRSRSAPVVAVGRQRLRRLTCSLRRLCAVATSSHSLLHAEMPRRDIMLSLWQLLIWPTTGSTVRPRSL